MHSEDLPDQSFTNLCSRCQSLFDPSLVHGEDLRRVTIPAHRQEDSLPALESLERSAKDGCLLCAELKTRILEQTWPESITDITIGPATLVCESYYREVAAEEDGPFLLEIAVRPVDIESERSDGCAVTLCFDLFATPGSYGEKYLRLRRSPPWIDRTSPECVAMMQSWLEECSTVHWPCASGGNNSTFLPTRLIDVGPADGTVSPRLVTRTEVEEDRSNKYIALSHCWGQAGPGVRGLKTVAATLEEHRRGIPLESMPQNFQDAVVLTRALGLRYVWIDSLCIIQDSRQDWKREGAQMDKVYHNAWVTVAATSAETSEDGFLAYPLRGRMLELRLASQVGSELKQKHSPPFPQSDCLQSSIFVRYMEKSDYSYAEPDVNETTWNSRGWTLQERHLAKRTLHFSRSQIFFECRDAYRSECGQKIGLMPRTYEPFYGPLPTSEAASSASISSKHKSDPEPETAAVSLSERLSEAEEEKKLSLNRLYTWWFQILWDYSCRNLTYGSDKLIAISGLASHLATTAQTLGVSLKDRTYLCGLWIGCLADCLLWVRGEPFLTTAKAHAEEGYRAPTWSWAAWDGEIIATTNRYPRGSDRNTYPSERAYFEYVGHDVALSSEENPYGCVRSASLVLRGRLRRISMAAPTNSHTRKGPKWAINMDLRDTDGVLLGYAVLDCIEFAETSLTATTLYAFAVVRQQPGSGGTEPTYLSHSGLVLQSTGSEHEFRRIGAFVLLETRLDAFEEIEVREFAMI